ncbi:hypothetical protein [Marinithermus hydrothermalis]|uniref:Uncharacterized protein n=1 Tax=Marinithermus hydrothermalis (strain DSM 14884 / JCM 11576 / T1) TaxID=869210 RepID=F2NPP5_MARHT|nr:hypothetical protein [Marinithermus hydrothermalis]AEB12546.1 hypothetical protein Marky_1814 [Marinithermus hydrothermalis DSM 14884]
MKRPNEVYIPPQLGVRALRLVLGMSLVLFLFYLAGHYAAGLPFPAPDQLLDILVTVGLGVGLGVAFSWVWPLGPRPGVERLVRTLLLAIPAVGLGIGVQLLLQGRAPTQALYLIFAVAAWLGSGFIVRLPEPKEK